MLSDKKTVIHCHACSKSPYKCAFLDNLWGYIEEKGCDSWIDKNKVVTTKPSPTVVSPAPSVNAAPTKLTTATVTPVTQSVPQQSICVGVRK